MIFLNKKFVYNCVSSFLSIRYDDKYVLILTVKDSKGIREACITKSCANYIDSNGVVLDNLVGNEVGRLYNSLNSDKKEK